MITGKNTLEIAGLRSEGGEDMARNKECIEDYFRREPETASPLDDLEFSEIGPETIPLKNQKSPEKNRVVEEKQLDEKPRIKPWEKLLGVGRRKYYSLLALTVAILAIGFYLLATQSYTVETKLVFVVGDTAALEREGWALGRELSILQNPGTGFLLSKRYYQGLDPSTILSSNEKNIPDPLLFKATSVDPSTVKNNLFKSSKDFESWISKSMSFDPDLANGQNRVAIRLAGPDPSLLKGVLQDYVGSYVDLRRVIDARAKEKTTVAMPQQIDNSVQERSIQRLDEKIKKLDELRYEYQLALNLMDSGGGSFSALALDSKSPASTTLTRFQDKIIQLEIERGALENRYTPQSREIKSVDFQIQGVKGLMKQYLVDQIEFVKKDKNLLIAQKNDLEGVTSDTRKSEKPRNLGRLSGLLVNGAKWYLLNDGLSVISEPPSITEKPFIAKLGEAKDAFVSSLFSPSAGKPGPLPSYDQRSLTQYSGQPTGPQSKPELPSQNYGPVQSNEMYREVNSYSRR
jgi:hypothetical protein